VAGPVMRLRKGEEEIKMGGRATVIAALFIIFVVATILFIIVGREINLAP
jgi:hypothetical protein